MGDIVATVHIVHVCVQKSRRLQEPLFGRGQTPSEMRQLFAMSHRAKPSGVLGHLLFHLSMFLNFYPSICLGTQPASPRGVPLLSPLSLPKPH